MRLDRAFLLRKLRLILRLVGGAGMARFDRGWVRSPREWVSSDPQKNIFADKPGARHMLDDLIRLANVVDTDCCKRGQVITSIAELMALNGCSSKRARLLVEFLEKNGKIGKQSGKRGTVITIYNFDDYCGNPQEEGKDEGKIGANKGQTEGQLIREGSRNIESKKYPPTPQGGGRTKISLVLSPEREAEKRLDEFASTLVDCVTGGFAEESAFSALGALDNNLFKLLTYRAYSRDWEAICRDLDGFLLRSGAVKKVKARMQPFMGEMLKCEAVQHAEA